MEEFQPLNFGHGILDFEGLAPCRSAVQQSVSTRSVGVEFVFPASRIASSVLSTKKYIHGSA